MKNNLKSGLMKYAIRPVLALSIVFSCLFLNACGDDEIITPEPVQPLKPVVKDTVSYNISSVMQMDENMEKIIKDAQNSEKFVVLNVTKSLAYSNENLETVKKFISAEDMYKNSVLRKGAWAIYPDAKDETLLAADWKAIKRPGLEPDPEDGDKFNVNEDEQDDFAGAGAYNVLENGSWRTGDINITDASEIDDAVAKAIAAAEQGHHVDVAFNGIVEVGNENISAMNNLLNENISISGGTIAPATDSVSVSADLLAKTGFQGSGRYNNGKFFYVSGVNGAKQLIELVASGNLRTVGANNSVFRTDTLSYGTDGAALSDALPARLFWNIHGANAAGLALHENSPLHITVETRADALLPGGETALGNVTNAVTKLLKTPETPYKIGNQYVYSFSNTPVIGTYMDLRSPSSSSGLGDVPAAPIQMAQLGDSIGTDGSLQMLCASNAKANSIGQYAGRPHSERLVPHVKGGSVQIKYTADLKYNDSEGHVYLSDESAGRESEALANPYNNPIIGLSANEITWVISAELERTIYNMSSSMTAVRENLAKWIEDASRVSITDKANTRYVLAGQLQEGKTIR
ncbi:MAG: hypothetical protein LBK26_02065 [Rickettsiales bacterium]|jgi:hypothetical protein|nr:hypothetical protein [Rickettsiales bacterium]